MAQTHYDVIIIGAGMSGMAAGIRLAYFDKSVCVLERHYAAGGLNSFYALDGHQFDVGLHAMTNYVRPGTRGAPLTKIFRQLRLTPEDFGLAPQHHSEVRFPGKTLRFNNDFRCFVQDVVDNFPAQADHFVRLVKHIQEYDELDLEAPPRSGRAVVSSFLSDPLLTDMIFCPLMIYGNAQERDMEFGQFVVMFKSIFCEGLGRPREGVRRIITALRRKLREVGGTVRMKCGVQALNAEGTRITSVTLDTGEILTANTILSSAGYVETMRLCGTDHATLAPMEGRLSFVEIISILDQPMKHLGHDATIIFYNTGKEFHYETPKNLVDARSGVICCPDNFLFDKPLPESMIRLTCLANFDGWNALDEPAYLRAKTEWLPKIQQEVLHFIPDFRHHVVYTDFFTPRTIQKWTGHLNGAVYGAPEKLKTGKTPIENLFICGTDQGFLGIVGAMLSGISMANLHVLKRAHAR
ncbi:MAG: NAD(P)/FAD-dependent oxidoreductase [Nitrospirae bacterium]|nr:MAG: NAD(P)/FAD-dependent oxidoreductase [Nitrospirota bacterium]